MESIYLERFKQLGSAEARETFKLNGGRLVVEILPPEEIKTAGGLIISSSRDQVKLTADSQRAILGVVLMTGEGYIDPDGKEYPCETQIGSVVMLNEFGLKYFSTFPGLGQYTANTIAMTSESEVQMIFPSLEAYAKFSKTLSANEKAQSV